MDKDCERLVKRLRVMRSYGGNDYECMDDAADMLTRMAELLAASLPGPSRVEGVTGIRFQIDTDKRVTLFFDTLENMEAFIASQRAATESVERPEFNEFGMAHKPRPE
jgi:hypothetical protein